MNQKVGLICEGGGTKAAYTSGVLKAFLDQEIYLPYSVGISAGAENLLPYVSRQPERLAVTGIEAGAQKDAVGWRPLFKEGGLFGIEATFRFLESRAPLDFDTFYKSSTKLDIGVYNFATGKVEYYDKTHLDHNQTLVKASCALLLLTKPYKYNNGLYMDAGLIDMISIEQSIRAGNEKHIFISTKEEGYVRKPAPGWQILLAKWKYRKFPYVAEGLKKRHLNYEKQWNKVLELEKEGKALVLRPSEDHGITRYTQDQEKLKGWFELGYKDTMDRLDTIKEFVK
ncbi:putative patatin/cPLA2 family phospholipase [Breznakia sp. PF5-3]|uniref:patatin-like phospholipase family protein n=1 Tax=unclassified Breznakia TaxID=2623764 RepID=UPI002405787D|nr:MULTISPECIES: patatin family protein [unclassified Breznakia]MDF9825562.1 putative patatin/cPLA2 family phospholipase [Breznakia sp. PM6-1]MDF9835869.1 putative patatin/cPLA2 family phospholipase [Breznakia sp. PF5-3]MDF9837614.1 putative patatin/cPLA2 family phospholipase [Breznakia sp. PFB2-8]MDF9860005.1 putative patatin/cPLA2 family phospholipase [Breznakia sp. PH5-24]